MPALKPADALKGRPRSDEMSAKVKELTLIIFGWILVLLGIIGVFLPIVPGVPLLLTGLLFLGRRYTWPRRFLTSLRTKTQNFTQRCVGPLRTVCRWLVRGCGSRKKAVS